MRSSSLQPAMAFHTASILLLSALSVVHAQGTVSPSNTSLSLQTVDLQIYYGLESMSQYMGVSKVQPLFAQIGLGQSINTLNSILLNGTLRLTTPFNYTGFSTTEIAYISCDPNSNTSNTDSSTVVNVVSGQKPKAIVLYSLTEPFCSVAGDFGYTSILSMTSIADSNTLRAFLLSQSNMNTMPTATIATQASISSAASSASSSTTQSGPTTAVAMSILYSITGIITVLFIVIIATGAVRAHRHPERYGPRGGFPGRPRQSRAKGLARAMLETLPIVKFGDDEPAKPVVSGGEIELADGTHHKAADVTTTSKSESDAGSDSHKTADAAEPGIGADTQAAAASVNSKEETADTLGCSICTEDFTKGEDVRVLPCNHKYHPACIDPWLLNASGTCPLCRVDLRPTLTNESTTQADGLAPPLEDGSEGHHRQASTGRIDAAALRAVPASERLAALRALRAERRQQQRDVLAQRGIPDPDAVQEEEVDNRRRNRLTMRLKEKFRVRTHRGDPTATEQGEASSATTAAPTTVSPVENGPTDGTTTSGTRA